MMTRFDLYGWKDKSINEIVLEVERALDLKFELRESFFRGGDYYGWWGDNGREVTLQENFEDEDGCLIEDEYPSFATLLYASGCEPDIYERIGGLPGAVLLRSNIL